jgi:hypothetical protein
MKDQQTGQRTISSNYKRAKSFESRPRSQQVDILDFLKPNPKHQRGKPKHQVTMEHTCSTTAHTTPEYQQEEPYQGVRSQSDNDDPMDESTGVDYIANRSTTDNPLECMERYFQSEVPPEATEVISHATSLIDATSPHKDETNIDLCNDPQNPATGTTEQMTSPDPSALQAEGNPPPINSC